MAPDSPRCLRPVIRDGLPMSFFTGFINGASNRSLDRTMRILMKRALNSPYWLAAAIAVMTFAVYLPSLRNDFVEWDDSTYIIENPFIRSFNMTFLRRAFFEFYASNWHPLTWVSHALDYAIWGLNPLGHHLTSIILHAINTFIVVLLIIRLVQAKKETAVIGQSVFSDERAVFITGGVAGLLFGLHPLHVESVAWIAERKDLLCALFYLLSITWYIRYLRVEEDEVFQRHSISIFLRKQYLFALGFFVLALLSKPMAVTLPIILLIVDWYPFRRIQSLKTFWNAFLEKLPFFVLSITSSIFTVLAQRAGGAITSVEVTPISTRVFVAAKSLVAYAWKMIAPLNLIPYYPYPENMSPLSFEYILAITLVVGITIICAMIAKKKKQNLLLSVWSYYVISLLPVIGIIQVGGQSMADRYMYLPSIGPFFLMGLVVAWGLMKINALQQGRLIIMVMSAATALFLITSLSYLTFEQMAIWRNSIDLWNYVIEKETEKVPLVYYSRGISLKKMGQRVKAGEDFDMAIALDRSYYRAYNHRGMLYGEDGSLDKAIEYFNKSIAINPNYANAYANRGFTFAIKGQYDKALDDFNKAIELDQNFSNAFFSRGNVYLRTGDKQLAILDLQKACDLGNDNGCRALQGISQGLHSE